MKWQTTIFWIIFALTILGVFTLIFRCAADQGDGAKKLKDWARQSRMEQALIPPSPKEAIGKVESAPIFYPTFFFVATATSTNGLESEYSNEIAWQYTKENPWRVLNVAWNPSATNGSISNYSVFFGRSPGAYTNRTECGTNLSATVRVLPPRLTNVVVTIQTVNGTNLAWSESLKGLWKSIGATSVTFTNPIGNRLWKAVGKNSRIQVSTKWQ